MKLDLRNVQGLLLLWAGYLSSNADGFSYGASAGINTAIRNTNEAKGPHRLRTGTTTSGLRPSQNTLYSTATDKKSISGREINNEGNEELILQKQKIAKEALLKLLENQKRELQATEALIQSLELKDDFDNDENTFEIDALVNGTDKVKNAKRTAPALTESIYAGVDYGFVSRSEGPRSENVDDLNSRLFTGYAPPSNILSLGSQQFMRNLNAIKGEYKEEANVKVTAKQRKLQRKLKNLTLNSTAIWERESARGEIVAPFIIKIPYYVLCYLLDVVFEGRYVFSRFFLLETVARMPYFSYITMLHLYETIGFWRRSSEVKRVHFAEEWNEYHHLLVMESLGGDQAWWVRFVAQHSALVYFGVLSLLWSFSPSLSYKFSEMLETHAVDTYGQFIDENEQALKDLPPSLAAVEYYTMGISDPMFGEYQTTAIATGGEIRKPGKNMKSLYDVFTAIRSDEGDHVGTMKACLDPQVAVLSPSLEIRALTGLALAASVGYYIATGDLSPADVTSDIIDGVDDTILGDSFVEAIIGAIAAFIQGIQSFNEGAGDLEQEVEVAEEVAAAGGIAVLFENFRQALAEILKLLRFFR